MTPSESELGAKQDMLDDYMKAQMDSLQMQINAQRTRMEVLEKRVTRQTNRLAIHLNDRKGHDQKLGVEGVDLDV